MNINSETKLINSPTITYLNGVKIIHSPDKYVTPEIVSEFFSKGKINLVDKVLTGNGATTAFAKIDAGFTVDGKKRFLVLIEPNVETVKDKNDNHHSVGAYKGKKPSFAVGKSVAAHFKGSINPLIVGRDDVLITVSDSFQLIKDRMMEFAEAGLIPYILVDESHTAESQATYRPKLKRFLHEIKDFIPYCQIAFVTATPNLFNKIDVEVANSHIPEVEIHLKNDEVQAVMDIKAKIQLGINVIVFTNSKGILASLRDDLGTLICDVRVGENLGRALVAECVLVDSNDANLIGVSGRGFEGWSFTRDGKDVKPELVHIYFFENRRYEHTSFFISNLYQAVSRPRLGAAYIEYIRIEKKTKPKPDKDVVKRINRFVTNAHKEGVETAIKKANKSLLDLTTISFDDRDVSIEPNEALIGLHREKILDNTHDFREVHKEFFDKRNITFIDERGAIPNVLRYKSVNRPTRIKNFEANAYYIEHHKLFDTDLQIDARLNWETPKQYLKGIELYMDRRNYKGNFKPSKRLLAGHQLFMDEYRYKALVGRIRTSHNKYYRQKLRNNPVELKKKLEVFDESHQRIIPKLIIQFMQYRIGAGTRYEYEVFREYTIWVMINMEVIRIVGAELGVTITELDIISCFPRIVYAKCGLPLPNDFYGGMKKNKLLINKAFNKLNIPSNRVDIGQFKAESRRKLRGYGLDEKVVNYLVDTYTETNKGEFFYDQAYHEMMIIRELVSQLKKLTDGKDQHVGIVRRHDSVLVFNLDENIDLLWVEHLEYLGQIGYFNNPLNDAKKT